MHNTGLSELLKKSLETLEVITKSLEELLETKRVTFPRCASCSLLKTCSTAPGHYIEDMGS